ncbi:628_t:CDS:1 [Diversispora eburnea]|uniref:628_t:CDS:1 n=1 Tax=Diversispora eburnea TaxID=1213867 RepID=A0A9N8ZAG0_9GLOM|nr:628_t:CDS:1 [Diversispora eburnea]
MSLNINYQNIKVPFPPTINVDEIVNIHLKNGIKNVNKTMNAFIIFRKEYNRVVAKFNLSSKDVSKFGSISWKNEPVNVKNHYRQMAKNVKKCFKKKVPSLCFINRYQGDSINDNHVPSGTVNPSLNTIQNFPPPLNQNQKFLNASPLQNSTYLLLDREYNSPDFTNFNLPPPNITNVEQNDDDFENICLAHNNMEENEFINRFSEDNVLTYKAICYSIVTLPL